MGRDQRQAQEPAMSLPTKPVAFGLLACGLGCLIASGLIAWGGLNTWLARGYLTTANGRAANGDSAGARAAARDAMEVMPRAPAAVVAAADLSTPANAETLLALMPGASADERATLAAAAALASGKAPDGGDANASDTALLVAIASKAPGPVTLSKDAPPHRAVLATWTATRLSAAFAAKRPDDVWQAASVLLTLAPKHPQAPELSVICAGLAPSCVAKSALIAAVAAISDRERSERLGVALLTLRPERNELRVLLPGGITDPATEAANALARAVAILKAKPATIHEGAIIRCLQADKPDLADELIAAAPATAQATFSTMTGLLDGDSFAAAPAQVSPPVVVANQLSFQLSNALGALPTKKISIRIGTTEVPSDAIVRFGTLITLPLKINGSQDVTISYDGKPVFAANLSL
jgi:hypothetical protein